MELRKWTTEEKFAIVIESIKGIKPASDYHNSGFWYLTLNFLLTEK